jgi:hypothetical protein
MRHPLNTPIGRFDIETDEELDGRCVASMPAHGLLSPITGVPSLGPLAVLVDHVGGLVNHYRRADDEWTVSSELSLELAPTCAAVIAAHPDAPVVSTVRSYFIQAPGQLVEWPAADDSVGSKVGLAAMMPPAIPVSTATPTCCLRDPTLR